MSELIDGYIHYVELSESFNEDGSEEERVKHNKYRIIADAYLNAIDAYVDDVAEGK